VSDQKKYVAAAAGPLSPSDFLNLWEVEELCRQARLHGLPDESDVRIEYDQTFYRNRYVVQHDPSKRRVDKVVDHMTPVEQAMASGGARFLSLGFIQSNDTRKPIQVRVEVQDDATGIVLTSLDLDEHQFARLLAGGVIKVKDSR
jgi:hypothetical protein